MLSNLVTALLVSAALFGTASAASPSFSDQPITLVVPHAAGTGVDTIARALAPQLGKSLGTSIIVENRVGANGAIGSLFVVRSKPDGRTLLLNANPPFVTYPMTQDPPLYDAERDFSPIAMVGSTPMALVVSAESGIDGMDRFVEYVKSHPTLASYASPGPGSAGHLAMERLAAAKNMKIQHVLYKSTPQSLSDVTAGHILSAFVSITSASPLLDSGRLRAIAVGSTKRLSPYPNVPTLKETTGIQDFEGTVWYGVLGPKGMSAEAVRTIYEAVAQAHAAPEFQSVMLKQSIHPELQTPDGFKAKLHSDTALSKALLGNISGK